MGRPLIRLESTHNKSPVIQRSDCGFRGHEYFFVTIQQVFPGNP